MLVALHASIFNLVTPAAIGADAYRVVNHTRRRGGRPRSAGLVLLERLFGLGSQAFVYILAFAWAYAVTTPAAPLPRMLGYGAVAFAALGLAILILSLRAAPVVLDFATQRTGRFNAVLAALIMAIREHEVSMQIKLVILVLPPFSPGCWRHWLWHTELASTYRRREL